MPKITIDGKEHEVPAGITIIQAADMLGVEIPRFCYHERLSVAGNCRMCLVEVEKMPKPVASCAQPVGDGMVIKTNSPVVKKAREGVMELLLINHPLDCPICDQGGECDLQDEAVAYGRGSSRFDEMKRAVGNKYMGPLIKTAMTRCIHCTRCVRFIGEIAGVEALGGIGRGEHTEIGTYVEAAIASELSGNLVDVCPVGALTSKPYAFKARPWELRKTESVDVLDAVGSNIRIDARGNEVMRVLPRLHEDVNEEWINDKTRHAVDGLRRQRLDRPYVREHGKLRAASWDEALKAVTTRLKGKAGAKIAAIAGDLCDAEAMFALKGLMTALGSPNFDCRQDGSKVPAGPRGAYLFNTSIAGIEKADVVLLVGSNPRHEATMINARLRKRWVQSHGKLNVAAIGPKVDLTYPVEWLGDSPSLLAEIAAGRHPFAAALKGASAPVMVVGAGALTRADGAAILGAARSVAEACNLVRGDWNGFNVLHRAASRVGGLDMGFVPGPQGRDTAGILDGAGKGEIEIVFLLGADEVDMTGFSHAFVVYVGHHGDAGAHRADVVLPGAAYTEKDGLYVNTEGRVQMARRAVFPPGEAKEDWTIFRALSERLGKTLPYDTHGELRRALVAAHPVFGRLDHVAPGAWGPFGAASAVEAKAFAYPISDFYMTDPVSRASRTMAECSKVFSQAPAKATGTHG
ncbi:MAG: NADH-quinone oxidoreductase subunit G [Alphaproteobacteria bacterium]|nr:NADH-quinone oxidoreductase subunit G [Alphaproteobacteria bacterium]